VRNAELSEVSDLSPLFVYCVAVPPSVPSFSIVNFPLFNNASGAGSRSLLYPFCFDKGPLFGLRCGMYILGIETSTKTGSIAVVSESGVIAQYSLNIEVTHSERLMSTVDRVLKDTGISIREMDAFAVAIGPGSFTGLRIGLATVKGLALALHKPVAAVPTLQALAAGLPFAGYPVCSMLDARKNEVYAALYRFEGHRMVRIMAEEAIPIRDLAGRISGKTLFTGEASVIYRAELERQFSENALFAPLAAVLPSAATVAEIGLALIKGGEQADLEGLAPLYIRRPEAEVAWEKRQRSP